MDIVLAGVAVAAFALVVLALVGAADRLQRGPARVVADPGGDEWMTVDQVAQMLGVPEADVVTLVDRDAIPYFILSGGNRSRPTDYRFRRDELEAWVIS
jgi:excisionase family DNA binding protein